MTTKQALHDLTWTNFSVTQIADWTAHFSFLIFIWGFFSHLSPITKEWRRTEWNRSLNNNNNTTVVGTWHGEAVRKRTNRFRRSLFGLSCLSLSDNWADWRFSFLVLRCIDDSEEQIPRAIENFVQREEKQQHLDNRTIRDHRRTFLRFFSPDRPASNGFLFYNGTS